MKREHKTFAFTDTTPSTTRFWQDILKGKLSRLQKLGIALVLINLAVVLFWDTFDLSSRDLSLVQRCLTGSIKWSIAGIVIGTIMLLVRRSEKNH